MTQESQSSTEAAPQDAHSGSTEPMPQDVRAAQELLDFIGECPSMFHTTSTIGKRLTTAGFTYLPETQPWNIEQGGTYYTTRNSSSVIAFKVGTSLDNYHFQITASHGDSPTFKVKSNAELTGPGESQRLNVEVYGGAVDYTWFDRPLGIAGRVMVKNGNRVESRLYESAEPLALIPSMPPHIQRDINQQFSPNRQVDLCPLFSAGALGKSTFDAIIADELGSPRATSSRATCSSSTASSRASGALRASSPPPRNSTTWPAHTPRSKRSSPPKTIAASQSSHASTTRRSARTPSRVPCRRFSPTRFRA